MPAITSGRLMNPQHVYPTSTFTQFAEPIALSPPAQLTEKDAKLAYIEDEIYSVTTDRQTDEIYVGLYTH